MPIGIFRSYTMIWFKYKPPLELLKWSLSDFKDNGNKHRELFPNLN